jgi:Glycosyl transferase family 11
MMGIYCQTTFAGGPQREFVTIGLVGQLGNQMFQIATAYSLARDHHAELFFPTWSNKDGLLWLINNSHLPHKPKNHYYEPQFHYAPISYKPDIELFGHFQSPKYFQKYREELKQIFAPNEDVLKYLHVHYKELLEDQNSVSIHFRNYQKEDDNLLNVYVLNGRNYIEKAIQFFPPDYNFYIFSDDINWCRENLGELAKNIQFISEPPIYDFYLMSACRHHIISNSTFSWWAAYLSPHSKEALVVAPKNWFQPNAGLNIKDLFPEEWILLPIE